MPPMTRRTAWSLAAAVALLAACQGGESPGSKASRSAAGTPKAPEATPSAATPAVPPEAPPASPAAESATAAAAGPVQPADRQAPSVPGKLVVTARSSTEVQVSWEASTDDIGVAGYEVFRGDLRVARGEELSAIDTKLRPDTRACYTVRAFDAAGNVSRSSAAACAQTLDTTPPTEPGQLTATVRPGGVIALAWGPSTDDAAVAAYEVWRAEKRLSVAGTTSFAESGLRPAEYCYSVRALDRVGNQSTAAGPACAVIPDVTPPSVPAGLELKAPGEHEVLLSWTASSDDVAVVRYEVTRTAGPPAAHPVTPGTGPAAREDGLSAATRYCYTVRACDAAENCSATSAEGCVTTPDLTAPTSPSPVAASAASDKEVELRWPASTDNVGVAGYEVQRGGKAVAPPRPDLSLREGGLSPAQKYCYAVVALDAAGNRSPPSAQACATTPDLTPPSVPDRPAAVSVSSTQMFVAWDPSTDDVGVVGYEVMRNGALVAGVKTTRARERNLVPNQEYCYTVRAHDAAGNRSKETPLACATTADPSQLASPSDLRVVRVSPTNVFLQWEPSEVPGVLYRIYAQKERSVGLTRGNTFTPSGKLGAESSCYRVAAVDEQGRESPRSNEICAKVAAAPLSAQ